jgi:PAS domain S-box-containing protein
MEVADLAWWEMDCASGAVAFHRRKTEMLDYDQEGFTSYADFTALLHPDDLEPTMEAMRAHLRGAAPEYRAEYRIRRRDGTYLWFQDVGRVTRVDDHGAPLTVTGVVFNITRRKRAEATARDQEERFRRLFDGHSAVMLVLDPTSGEIVDANAAAAAFYGWSIEELRGKRIQEINTLAPADIQRAMDQAASERNTRFEFKHRRASGTATDVEVFSNRVDVGGRALLYSIIHDISDRKRMQAALVQSERSLVRAEEFARFGHWELSLDELRVRASEGACRIYGFQECDVPLPSVQRCVLLEHRPRIDAALRDLIEGTRPYDVEFEIRRVSDDAIVAVHSKAEYDARNRMVFGVVQDITARKRIEAERENLILQLQSAVEHIKTLKGIVPICSSCKKIRDDKGYWQQVEAYVTRHTEAQFSHGICPECAARLYPDV